MQVNSLLQILLDFKMMRQLVHIANTDVEFEYAESHSFSHPSFSPTNDLIQDDSIKKSLSKNPICLQLQFLPLLCEEHHDLVAVTSMPFPEYFESLLQTQWYPKGLPRIALQEEKEPFLGKKCLSWGISRRVERWAKERQMIYDIPKEWDTICRVNSKAFSFFYSSLSQAALIENKNDLVLWLEKTSGPKVLKTCFGLSGKGNCCFNDLTPFPQILHFCSKEWEHKRPVIAEPWLDRVFDFSTQWYITPNQNIEFRGALRFQTDSRGNYQGTISGPENVLFASFESFLDKHKNFVIDALKDMSKLGFYGDVGIDALVYRDFITQKLCLYPLVEINARQTMSLVALRLQQKLFPQQILLLSFKKFDNSQFPLLPCQLADSQGEIYRFRHNLTISLLPSILTNDM